MRFICFALALSATLTAQDLPFLKTPPAHVTVTTSVSKSPPSKSPPSKSRDSRTSKRSSPASDRTEAIQAVQLVADVLPKPNIHVYAPGADGYQVVTLTIDPRPGVTAGPVRYPKSELLVTDVEKVPVFSRTFQLAVPVTLDRAALGASPLTLTGKLQLQACDDQICYKPETIPLSWEIPQ